MLATVKVLTPAAEISLATLFELKSLLSFGQSGVTDDTGLTLMLRRASGEIAAYCRRQFAEEEVIETFRDFTAGGVFFLSRFPVKQIVSISSSGGALVEDLDWAVDCESGMLSCISGATWGSPLAVRYVGGYRLPHEAPQALRQAALILCRESFFQSSTQGSAAASGIKMIAHKESRIMFQNTTGTTTTSSGGASTSALASGSSAARRAIGDLLIAYTKFAM